MAEVDELRQMLATAQCAVAFTGAGISTESGIPDYRGPSGQARRAQPMTYQEFTGSGAARQRYWARSHLGWRHITGAGPNAKYPSSLTFSAYAGRPSLGLARNRAQNGVCDR